MNGSLKQPPSSCFSPHLSATEAVEMFWCLVLCLDRISQVSQVDLEIMILLPPNAKCSDPRHWCQELNSGLLSC